PDAVEYDSSGFGARNGGYDRGGALGESLQVGPEVEGGSELRGAAPDVPELAVLRSVERQMQGPQRGRPRSGVRTNLIVVAQVDHRAHSVAGQRSPARSGQPVERVRAHDASPAGLLSVPGAQTAQI